MTTGAWPAGLLTAVVTPFTDDEVDIDAMAALVEHQVSGGVSGLVVGGGTGEFYTLTMAERQLLATETVRAVSGRIPVIVQTGALATRDAITLSRQAEAAGASALLVASPFGDPINWTERFHFYEVLSGAVAIPVMIYNTPPSGFLTFDQIRELAELPNITAVKDSSGSSELMGDLSAWAGPDFGVYVGVDTLMYEAINGGARGAVFGAANLIPEPLSAVARSLRENGATPQAHALWQQHLRPFLRFLELSPNYMALCKAGLALLGLPVGDVRAPFLVSQRDEVDELARRLDAVAGAFAQSSLAPAASVAGSGG